MDRININVPYSEKDEAKSKGAKWDSSLKTWYLENEVDLNDFEKWLPILPTLKANKYFIAETEMNCWKCKRKTPVYSLFLKRYEQFDVDEYSWYWDENNFPSFVTYVSNIDEKANQQIKELSNNKYRINFSKQNGSSYYMNHCSSCNMKQGDFSVHEDNPGVGFFITDLESFSKIKFYEVDEYIELVGSTSFDSILIDINERSSLNAKK